MYYNLNLFPCRKPGFTTVIKPHSSLIEKGKKIRSKIYVPATANTFPMPVTESLCDNWEPSYRCSLPTGNAMEAYLRYQVKYGEFSGADSLPQKQ